MLAVKFKRGCGIVKTVKAVGIIQENYKIGIKQCHDYNESIVSS